MNPDDSSVSGLMRPRSYNRRHFAALVAAGVLAFVPQAAAWTLGAGTEISWFNTTLTVGQDTELTDALTFEAVTNAPILDGVTLNMSHDDESPSAWTLDAFSFLNITITGSPSSPATMRVMGLPMGAYWVRGVSGNPEFAITQPGDASWAVPAGLQTISITPDGENLSGNRLQLDADWSPDTGNLTASVALLAANGMPLTGGADAINVTIYAPGGGFHGVVPMVETATPGAYSGVVNLSLSPALGGWVVAATLFGLSPQTEVVIVASGVPIGGSMNVSLAVDSYLPFLIWGGVGLLFLYFRAHAPAFVALLAVVVNLFSPPLVSFEGQVMLMLLILALHVMVEDFIRPAWAGRRSVKRR